MNQWRQFVYAVPDDGGRRYEHVIDALPIRLSRDLTCLPYGGFRLQVADPAAALFLRLAVNGLGVSEEGYPFLEPGDLYVPDWLRQPCERELGTRCRSAAIWDDLIWAEFRTPEARAHFEEALNRAG